MLTAYAKSGLIQTMSYPMLLTLALWGVPSIFFFLSSDGGHYGS
jgi:hypothetical protein